MYQFSVSNPKEKVASIKFLRKWSSLGIAELSKAIESTTPIITLDYRDDLEVLEFSEWIEKVKLLNNDLSQHFEKVIIGYAPAHGDEIEIVSDVEFQNLLDSEMIRFDQEYD